MVSSASVLRGCVNVHEGKEIGEKIGRVSVLRGLCDVHGRS